MKTFKNFTRIIFGLSAMVFLVYAYAFATADVGTVTYVEGRADVLRENTTMTVPLREGELIFLKDIVRTKSDSKAEITFKDKSVLRLAQNSRVQITDYQLDEQNRRKQATINLARGKARTIISKMQAGADFNILTPNTQGKIKGSDVFAFFQAGVSGMLVSSGTLSVANIAHPNDAVIVQPGNSVVVPETEVPRGPRPYLEMEKKFHEQDTNPPAETLRKRDLAIIRGAITKISGIVKITAKGERISREAKINEIVGAGDTIETGSGGKIEIKFENGNAINIKPNSRLLIVKLTADPKTHDYDNHFELSFGKIRAVIEKLPQNSSFRVKTPTAICGVRGSIMDVEATEETTKMGMEDGQGELTSLATGETRQVGTNEFAFVHQDGTVSESLKVPDEEQKIITGEDDESDSIDQFSSSEGQDSLTLSDLGQDIQTMSDTGEGDVEETTDTTEGGDVIEDSSDEPQITETTPDILSPPSTPQESFQGDFIGNFGYFDAGAEESPVRSGSLSAILSSTDSFWSNPASFSITGEYSNPDNHSQWYDTFFVEGSTSDGAVFLGRLGGIKVNDSLEGLLYGLYIRPVGDGIYRAGYIKSTDITGNFYPITPITGTFNASGTLTTHLDLPTGFSPEELYGKSPLHGQNGPALDEEDSDPALISGDTFSGTMEIDSADITDSLIGGDQEWAIWWMAGAGEYTDSPSSSWEAVLGIRGDNPEWYDYAIGHITGDAWSGNKFLGTVSGRSISLRKDGLTLDGELGSFRGDILGTYDESNWQAIGMGVYADQIDYPEQPLKFGASFNGGFGKYIEDLNIDFSTDPDWETNNSNRYYWDSAVAQNFYTNNYTNSGEYATIPILYDGGSFRLEFDMMVGQRGYLNPGDICFGLFGPERESHSRPAAERVFILMGGYFHEIYIEGTDQTGTQIAAQNYRDIFEDNKWYHFELDYDVSTKQIDVSVTDQGTPILTFTVDVAGGLSSNLTNLGVSMNGTWETTGRWQTVYIDNIVFDLAQTFMLDLINTSISGVIGGVNLPWSGTNNPITIMGEFNNLGNYSLWANDADVMGKTADGGVFLGVLGGINVNNSLKGLFGAFYIRDPDPEVENDYLCGYLLSNNIEGKFYPGIGMFEADGTITPSLEEYPTIYSPSLLYDGSDAFIAGVESQGTVTGGTFQGTYESDSAQIADQEWGLWRSAAGGTYTGATPGAGWEADIGGRLTNPESDELIGYSKGIVSGGAWQDNQFSFTLSGYWLTEDYGSFSGEGIGTYADGTWQMLSIGVRDDNKAGLKAQNLIGLPNDSGGFDGVPNGGRIYEDALSGTLLNIDNQNWGIYSLAASGTYEVENGMTDSWGIGDLTGALSDPGGTQWEGGAWLGGFTGHYTADGTRWSNNTLLARFNAVWIELNENGWLSGRRMSGDVQGTYIEVETGGTWQAASAGEWVEVDALLDLTDPEDDVVALGTPLIPITEVYTSLLTGTGAFDIPGGGALSATLNMDFYAKLLDSTNYGIWAASIVNGNYAKPTDDSWTLNVINGNLIDSVTSEVIGTVSATLAGSEWSPDAEQSPSGHWEADVTGSTSTGMSLNGVAAGTYTETNPDVGGTFSGAGTGTWENPD